MALHEEVDGARKHCRPFEDNHEQRTVLGQLNTDYGVSYKAPNEVDAQERDDYPRPMHENEQHWDERLRHEGWPACPFYGSKMEPTLNIRFGGFLHDA
jgi:hypothetical protein